MTYNSNSTWMALAYLVYEKQGASPEMSLFCSFFILYGAPTTDQVPGTT